MSAAPDEAAPSFPGREELVRLASARPALPVLSVYLRTDPRDPSNTRAAPAWSAALTHGLNEVSERLEASDERDARLAFRELHERVLAEASALAPAELGRGIAWFAALDGSLERRWVSRLPVGDHLVRLDVRPYVSPLVDLADRGQPAGIVLVGQERVRLLEWAHGWIDEEQDHELEIDQSDWRPHRGSAGGGRTRPTVTHTEHVAAREEAHRDRFIASAAASVARRIAEAGWERVALVGADGLAPRFHLELPETARDRVQLDLDLNLLALPAGEVALRLEPHLDAVHRQRALALADRLEAAGSEAASGPAAVLAALAERRVQHLLIDPFHDHDTTALPPIAAQLLDDAEPGYAGERAVEAALESDARITTASVHDSPALARADGMLAEPRW